MKEAYFYSSLYHGLSFNRRETIKLREYVIDRLDIVVDASNKYTYTGCSATLVVPFT